MFLKSLKINNFKIYQNVDIQFNSQVICLTGPNGSGKTNLLDAIYYLCVGKSYFNPVDHQNIHHGKNYYRIEGKIEGEAKEIDIIIGTNETGKKKKLTLNEVQYVKISDHIGKFPVVIIAPDDIMLINGGSSERRKFMDFILSFSNFKYLKNLQDYNRILMQRNSHLKSGITNEELLISFDVQMIEPAKYIYKIRDQFIGEFLKIFITKYDGLIEVTEKPSLEYESALHSNSLDILLNNGRRLDRITHRTNYGIHKDNLNFTLNGHPIRKFGSQGQKKTFLLALKLAQYDFLKEMTFKKPVLLLDDIYDRLDATRVSRLISTIADGGYGQVFITDTNPQRLSEVFDGFHLQIDKFDILNGEVDKNAQTQ